MFLSNKKIKRLFDYWKEKKPNYFDYNTIGKTNLHQNIYFCTITNKQEVGEKESILFIGSIHGDEISGVYLCREFIHHLMIQNNQDNYLEGKIIYILPTLNPDGYGNHVGKKWIPKRTTCPVNLLKLDKVDFEEGWHYIRVSPWTVEGDPIPLADNQSDDNRRSFESEPFYVLPNGSLEEEPPQRLAT